MPQYEYSLKLLCPNIIISINNSKSSWLLQCEKTTHSPVKDGYALA